MALGFKDGAFDSRAALTRITVHRMVRAGLVWRRGALTSGTSSSKNLPGGERPAFEKEALSPGVDAAALGGMIS